MGHPISLQHFGRTNGLSSQVRRGVILSRQHGKTEIQMRLESMARVLVITGDGGESYEALYAVHRFREEGWEAVVRLRHAGGCIL